jgi:translation initiation factor 4G
VISLPLKLQILEVGITHQKTLEGLIDQIFDKALTETNFCEMYAQVGSIKS